MGPPRTRARHLLAQRGRFQEGSMNDRVSAVPPVQFLGPQEREALERPVDAESSSAAAFHPAYFGRYEEQQQQQQQQQQQMPSPQLATRKPAVKLNIFGQVWEGVRGRFRLRRDADDREKEREKKRDAGDETHDRLSRDEVFASYQQLVASGFFSSHAIQSTRHGPPPNCRPSTSHGPAPKSANSPPPWPLAPAPLTPQSARPKRQVLTPQTVYSPVSVASSRGTKRAAESPVPSHDDDEDEEHDDGEDESTLAHRFLPKRLRISASRDISLPKLRSVASRKHMRAAAASARRSVSAGGKEREPNKLTKKVPWARQQDHEASLDVPSGGRKIRRPSSARSLRPVATSDGDAVLKVVPDANRGIPRVPDIPAKFTYGEDRENGVPWRGLRR
ncbi:hypothetical protein NOR_05469 [Metarhizium rileyi]|uniref:Uncharacterized protein n=1 Tax=Metarhizium rileyi (strain RCEF 4871) TaxID=1649241 RepID=A0A167CNG1_METRR|nr:hypothetical protein NOR_05469 [Metarhizium rileyi RCEF 4871]